MTDQTKAAEQKAPEAISEEDLLKSITDLQAKAEPKAEEKKEPELTTAKLDKTVADTVKEKGSETLKKSIDVSDSLTEFAAIVGLHVDRSLTALEKSVNEGAKRDMAFLTVLKDLKKSVDDLSEKVAAMGNAPTAPLTKTAASDGKVLEKSATLAAGEKKVDPSALRSNIAQGLIELTKSATDPNQASHWGQVAAKFESTGTIDDTSMKKAIVAYTKATQAA